MVRSMRQKHNPPVRWNATQLPVRRRYRAKYHPREICKDAKPGRAVRQRTQHYEQLAVWKIMQLFVDLEGNQIRVSENAHTNLLLICLQHAVCES